MNKSNNRILDALKGKHENETIEYKEAKEEVLKEIYPTVCSFANREGGIIFLGVDDDGNIKGVNPDKIEQMKKNFVTVMNNNNKITPPMYLSIEEMDIQGEKVLYIQVPNDSSVHRLNGNRIYDRNEDADIDITDNTNSVAELYQRKQQDYTENRIYPYISEEDFDIHTIEKFKDQFKKRSGENKFEGLSVKEFMKSLSLHKKDYSTNEEGYTLASVLLFGKSSTINSIIPYYCIDLWERKGNERYTDREIVRCNLIEAYDKIMNFVRNHISDKFYLENDVRINIRNVLFREIVVNMLVHREYSNPGIATLSIEPNKIVVKNVNKPIHPGMITSPDIAPYPKNPNITHVFMLLGLVEHLGSGIGKIFEYTKKMYNSEVKIQNMDEFIVTIPITAEESLTDNEIKLLEYVKNNKKVKIKDIVDRLKISRRNAQIISKGLVAKGFLKLRRTSATDPNQFYEIANKNDN